MSHGTVPYPAAADPGAVEAFAASLRAAARTVGAVDRRCDTAAAYARSRWRGVAATTFVDHMEDRAHTLELGRDHLGAASDQLAQWAAAMRSNREWYDRFADRERALRAWPNPSPDEIMRAIAGQQRAVDHLRRLGVRFARRLAEFTKSLDERARRGFVSVGSPTRTMTTSTALTGTALIADALTATEDGRIRADEIQIRRLSDGSYIVIMPGVTDLSTLGGLLESSPVDTVRLTGNAVPTATRDGAVNPYAEMVQMAMLRAGVPAGASVTFVGHSYGSYTGADLVIDDDFNSADGDSNGYHVNIRRNISVAADVDWKIEDAPRETDVIVLNSRDDSVYQTEAQLDPEVDWWWRTDRPILGPMSGPLRPIPRLPRPGSSTTYPSGERNHIEREVSAGRGFDGDDKMSGHHPNRYGPFVRRARVGDPIRPILDGTGDATVVETFNVRVPNRTPRPASP